jgi:hypothetical protein
VTRECLMGGILSFMAGVVCWMPLPLLWLNGAALGAALFYTLVFLPLMPVGVIAIIFSGRYFRHGSKGRRRQSRQSAA